MKLFGCKQKQERDVVMVDDRQTTPTKTRALLIGINYIGTSSELRGCINDVNHMYRFLTSQAGYDAAEIRVLTDDRYVPDSQRPTRANILTGIRWLLEAASDRTTPVKMFLHYSGHGSWMRDTNGDERDGRDETICPVDYDRSGMIKDDDLYKELVEPLAAKPNVNLTCLFDCCHSGTVLDLRYEYEIAINSSRLDRRSYSVNQNTRIPKTDANILLFSGSLDTQTSADAYIDGKSQGAMTWGFLEVINKYQSQKKACTLKRFLSEVQLLLRRNGYDQIPHLCASKHRSLNSIFSLEQPQLRDEEAELRQARVIPI